MKSKYLTIDTPALLIDQTLMLHNIDMAIAKTSAANIKLRPHTKTHRMPELAKLCLAKGATGITVAKIGEAEVMAENGLDDIFIANELIGLSKYQRLKQLHEKITISLGVDSIEQIQQIEQLFKDATKPLPLLMEIEVGENRSGVITNEQIIALGNYLLNKPYCKLIGVFSHEGHCYKAASAADCITKAQIAHLRTIEAANILKNIGHAITTISVGSTPSLMHAPFTDGITEVRPGTFILMDVGQGSAINNFDYCAATVLASIISKPTDERVVLDAGAKCLTSQNRAEGICTTNGYGLIKNSPDIRIAGVFDEHAVIYDKNFHKAVKIGDKIEIIPNHICPTCNLYDTAYLVDNGKIIKEIPILCRGKSQ